MSVYRAPLLSVRAQSMPLISKRFFFFFFFFLVYRNGDPFLFLSPLFLTFLYHFINFSYNIVTLQGRINFYCIAKMNLPCVEQVFFSVPLCVGTDLGDAAGIRQTEDPPPPMVIMP